MNARVPRSVLPGVLLTALWACGCSKAPPPPKAPPPRPPSVADVANERFVNEMPLWRTYSRSVREGDWAGGRRHMASLEATFRNDAVRRDFWAFVLPAGRAHSVQFALVCPSCREGKCTRCGGDGRCPVCKGENRCAVCGGRGQLTQRCEACICRACRGAGFCSGCLGEKTLACERCRGTALTGWSRMVPCERCRGTGKLTAGISGDLTRPCPLCRGVGKTEESGSKPCEACEGKGRVACDKCEGQGTCLVCKGAKRTALCAACGQTGAVTSACPRCRGTGKCTECAGWLKCGSCEGRGLCARCQGAQRLGGEAFRVDVRWLRSPGACYVQEAARFRLDGQVLSPAEPGVAWGAVPSAAMSSLQRGISPLNLQPRKDETLCLAESNDFSWAAAAIFSR